MRSYKGLKERAQQKLNEKKKGKRGSVKADANADPYEKERSENAKVNS